MSLVLLENHEICLCLHRKHIMLGSTLVDYDRVLRDDEDYLNTLVPSSSNTLLLLRYIIRTIPYMDLGVYQIQIRLDGIYHSTFLPLFSDHHVATMTMTTTTDFSPLFSFDNNLVKLFGFDSIDLEHTKD
jgi:hypothetical protein